MPPDLPSNLTGVYGIFKYVNDQTGFFGAFILIMVFVVSFLAMKGRFTSNRAFAGSTFLTFIVAALLRALDLITNFSLLITVAGLILALMWLKFDEQ